jgi:hypothetical protein
VAEGVGTVGLVAEISILRGVHVRRWYERVVALAVVGYRASEAYLVYLVELAPP